MSAHVVGKKCLPMATNDRGGERANCSLACPNWFFCPCTVWYQIRLHLVSVGCIFVAQAGRLPRKKAVSQAVEAV